MELSITTTKFEKIENEKVKSILSELNSMYLEQIYNQNKVAFYYEDRKGNIFSFNKDICFYAASTIKVLACLLMYRLVEKNKFSLDDEILIKLEDHKQDSGIIKLDKEDKNYTIKELIRLCIVESDNTAYLKLVDLLGKDNIEEFGKALGAIHTMEGKDSFGIVNCTDMLCYFKAVKDYINNGLYGKEFNEYLINPSFNIIDLNNIDNKEFVKKYGLYDIAYHEVGYVESDNEYYMFILTQLNKEEYKEEFINKTAKLLCELNKTI